MLGRSHANQQCSTPACGLGREVVHRPTWKNAGNKQNRTFVPSRPRRTALRGAGTAVSDDVRGDGRHHQRRPRTRSLRPRHAPREDALAAIAYQHHGVESEPDPVVIRRAASFAVRDGHGPTGELLERSGAPVAANRGRRQADGAATPQQARRDIAPPLPLIFTPQRGNLTGFTADSPAEGF